MGFYKKSIATPFSRFKHTMACRFRSVYMAKLLCYIIYIDLATVTVKSRFTFAFTTKAFSTITAISCIALIIACLFTLLTFAKPALQFG